MPDSRKSTGPPAAYYEDCEEESQDAIPGTKHSANVAAKRKPEPRASKKHAGRDSGYGSRTTTESSSSQGSKKESAAKPGFMRTMAWKVTGTSGKKPQVKEPAEPSAASPGLRRSLSRSHKAENLRLESREDAARMRVSGTPVSAPVQPAGASRGQAPKAAVPSASPSYSPATVPLQAVPIPRPRPTRASTGGSTQLRTRPVTYHDGMGVFPGYSYPMHVIESRPQPQHAPQLYLNTAFMQQHQSVPAQTSAYIQSPSSANRQIAYPFPPTTFDHNRFYPSSAGPWPVNYAPPPPPPPPLETLRRPSWSGSLVEYPQIPAGFHRTAPQSTLEPLTRRTSVHRPEHQRVLIPEEGDEEDDLFFMEDESYYREQLDRQRMPPPPVPRRPPMRHAVTTTSTSSHRPQPPSPQHHRSSSPRNLSLDGSHPSPRPSLASRQGSSDRHKDTALLEEPPSPMARRRLQQRLTAARPVSYHGSGSGSRDLERQVEAYQAARNGTARAMPLPPDPPNQAPLSKRPSAAATAKHSKHGKTASSGGGAPSEAGSRASSSRDGSDSKKRSSTDQPRRGSESEGKSYSLTMPKEVWSSGHIVKVRQSREDGGIEFSIAERGSAGGSTARPSQRDSRPCEREEIRRIERRYSTAGREAPSKRDSRDDRTSAIRDDDNRTVLTDPSSSSGVTTLTRRRESSARRARSTRRESSASRREHSRRRDPSRHRRRSRSRGVVVSERHADDASRAALVDGEAELTERFRRLRADSQSRRSSRSAVSARTVPAVEGQAL